MAKYTIDFSKDAVKQIDDMAKAMGGVERATVLRRALGLLKCALRETEAGKRLAVTDQEGNVEKEILLQ